MQDWSDYRDLNGREIASVPDLVFLELDSQSDLAFARDLRKLQPGIRLIACSGQKEPTSELLLEAMRIGVCDILRSPIDRAELRNTLTRIMRENAASAPAPTPEGKLFVVMGTKGGVGTSTVAVNLGVQLAQIPDKRTILVDFSRPPRTIRGCASSSFSGRSAQNPTNLRRGARIAVTWSRKCFAAGWGISDAFRQ